MNEFAYLIRREFWEHRAFFIVPLIIAAVIIIGDMAAIVKGADQFGLRAIGDHIADGASHLAAAGDDKLEAVLGVILFMLGTIFFLALGVVVLFYLLDCLYSDRKDRSVLFWKSLPISDTSTVLSKLAVAVVAAPVIALIAAVVTYVVLLIIASVLALFAGQNPFTLLWANAPLFSGPFHFLTLAIGHAIWFLPFSCWLLFCSATARKAPFLLAFLAPALVIFLEWLVFDSYKLATALGNYADHFYSSVFGPIVEARGEFGVMIDGDEVDVVGNIADFGNVLSAFASLYAVVGLAVAGGLFFATVWMRRHRTELS